MNILHVKWNSDRLVIASKGFLELPNLFMLIKQESIASQKLGFCNFFGIANNVPNEGKSTMPITYTRCCLLHLIKQNCFLKTFLWALNLLISMKFFSPVVVFYLYEYTILPFMGYCCHVYTGTPSCYLDMFGRLPKMCM